MPDSWTDMKVKCCRINVAKSSEKQPFEHLSYIYHKTWRLTPILSARPKTDKLRLLVQGDGQDEYRKRLKWL